MIEPDDSSYFAGLALEEPSAEADRRILALARAPRPRAVRGRRWVLVLGAAAAALVIAAGILHLPPGLGPDGGRPSADDSRTLRAAVTGLRTELEQIDEMSDLIPPEREAEREAILARVRACLADVEKLELRLSLGIESSSLADPSRKENRV